MENFPKRGRPRKIPKPRAAELGLGLDASKSELLREYFGQTLVSSRTHANAFYADQGRGYVEIMSEQAKRVRQSGKPHDPLYVGKLVAGFDWILSRQTVLTELGRMADADEDLTEQDFQRIHHVVEHVAERYDKLTAKAAVAYIRRQRMGETKRRDRVASLHHDLNAAINLHRQRFPESTWADIRQALERTAGQIERKLPS
jgi:hypothetical protein